MAYVSIPSSLRQVGKATRKELFDQIHDNLEDLNTRSTVLEGNAGKIIVFSEIVLNASSLGSGGTITGLDMYRAAANFTLTDAKVWIFTKGSLTGTLEIDVQVSSSADFTSSVSVFTTNPSIDYSTASDYDESSNSVFDNTNKEISAGDYIRLDVSELPANGTLGKFGIYLIGESA